MNKVSVIVKKIINETLTTHSIIYMSKFFNVLIQDFQLDVNVNDKEFDTIVFEYPLYFDDIKIEIISYIYTTGDLTKKQLEYIDRNMQFYGFYFSKRTEEDYNNAPAYIYSYIPNKLNKVLKNTLSVSKYLYHICPDYVKEKIKKTGLIPKYKNTLYKYNTRIHLCVSNTPYEELRMITYLLDLHNKSEKIIINIGY